MNNEISVMLSIHPEYCQLIASGKKTVEVRKTIPKTPTPFKAYIYCTLTGPTIFLFGKKANGKVIGEFVCDDIDTIFRQSDLLFSKEVAMLDFVKTTLDKSCLSLTNMIDYANDKDQLYALYITKFKLYEKPKELSDFMKTSALSFEKWMEKIYNGSGLLNLRYEDYLKNFELLRPPQSWCYVQEKETFLYKSNN